jgi:hypothetical protein
MAVPPQEGLVPSEQVLTLVADVLGAFTVSEMAFEQTSFTGG